MTTSEPGTAHLTVFLTEDDLVGSRPAAEAVLEAAASAGLTGRLLRGVEGFGRDGHLRAERLPDLARGLPQLVELGGDEVRLDAFLAVLHRLVPGSLVTVEPAAR